MTFKVIVAGGGPIGLTAALALSQANIDFVVLEKYGKIVAEAGSDVVISPIGLRIISQLGLFEEFIRVSSELLTINRNDHNGRNIGDVHWFHFIKENFGEAPRVLRRYDLTKLLYEGLTESNRAKILTNKEVSSVETVPEGVTVTCADGTTYTGNMVIGADGAHSSVRSEMRKLAIAAGSDKINEQDPFLTTFLCFWLRFSSDGLVPGTTSETHGYGAASQLFVGQESAVSGIYVPLEKPTRERLRFAETDQEDLVKKFAKVPLTSDGKVTFESAWASRTDSGLVSLEEGVLDHWSWDGRIVLAGDAAHKFTPSTGAGCNNGIIDVVVLVNKLHSLLQEKSTPSAEELGAVFQEYQEDRKPEVTFQCKTSGRATATATWAGTVFRLSDLYVMSWRWVQKYFMDLAATKISKAPSFAFLPQDTNVVGKVPWQSAQTAVSAK